MTRTILALVGTILVAGAFTGCGPKKTDEVSALKLQVANLKGRVQGMESTQVQLEEDKDELSMELAEAEQEAQAKDSEINDLKIQLAGKPVGATAQSRTVIEEISGKLLFRAGSDKLTAAGKRTLDNIANRIKGQYSSRRISVEGHPDSAPLVKTLSIWHTNMWLATNRARAVADYLMERGVPENRLSVVGHGASPPGGRKIAIVVE